MKRFRFPLVIAILTFLIACDKEDDVPQEIPLLDNNVELEITTKFGAEDLELNTFYPNVEGFGVKVDVFRFYLSEIYLTKDNGEDVLISEMEFFDRGITEMTRSYSVPAGTYTGFKYSLGLPEALNGTGDPDFNIAQYGPDHPLSIDNGMYWAWSAGYRFLVFDGKVDTIPNSSSNIPTSYSIHTGHDEFLKTIEYAQSFEVTGTELSKLNIIMDVDRFMYNESDTLNFNTIEDTNLGGPITELAFRFSELLDGAISEEIE